MPKTKDKRLTKTEAAKLTKDWCARVKALGGVYHDGKASEGHKIDETKFLFATRGGSLLVTVHCEAGDLLETIYTRFEHPELARRALDVGPQDHSGRLNPYSGKYNFHGWSACDDFEAEVGPLLFPKVTA